MNPEVKLSRLLLIAMVALVVVFVAITVFTGALDLVLARLLDLFL